MTRFRQAAIAALLVGLISAPTLSRAWIAWNGNDVFQIEPGVFEVIGRAGRTGAQHYWCAAGDYARRVLRTPAAQRLYIHKAIGPSVARPGARAVQFALQPPPEGPAEQSYSLSVKAVGDNMTRSMAFGYCRKLPLDFF